MMDDSLGSSRVSSHKQNREGMVGAQSRQYRATMESSEGCGGGLGRDVVIWYQNQSLVGKCAEEDVRPLRGVDCMIPHH